MIFTDNRELLDGFRRGDKSALLEVYRAYVRDVSRFLMRGFSFESAGRRCSFRGFAGGYEIEAAVQEVFRRAFEERARNSYDGIHPYRPYLLRIARNAVLNDLKSKHPILFRFRAGRPVIIDAPPAHDPEAAPSNQASQQDIAEAREVAKLVQAFKDQLEPRALGVFNVRFEDGLSAEKAASQLGLTRSQIRTTEAKVRKSFLAHMQSSGYLTGYRGDSKALQAGLTALIVLASWGVG